MKDPSHELEAALQSCLRLLETTLHPSTICQYRRTVQLFLSYLRESHRGVKKPSQLRRDPHLLGWLEYLWKQRTRRGEPLKNLFFPLSGLASIAARNH